MSSEPPQCWYCKKTSDGHMEQVDLYFITDSVFVGIGKSFKYKTAKMHVPRCSNCKRSQDRFAAIVLSCLAATFIVSAVSWFNGWSMSVTCGFPGVGVLVCAGLLVVWQKARVEDYPPIKAMIDQGWKIGTEPSKTD